MADTEMREPTFLMLTALADGPKHGYGVMHAVTELSDGRVQLRAGTLYAALDRLVREGLIVEVGQEIVDGRLRRYYDLTDEGASVLSAEVRRLRSNAAKAHRRLRVRTVTA